MGKLPRSALTRCFVDSLSVPPLQGDVRPFREACSSRIYYLLQSAPHVVKHSSKITICSSTCITRKTSTRQKSSCLMHRPRQGATAVMMIRRIICVLGVHVFITKPSAVSAGGLPAGPTGDWISTAAAAGAEITNRATLTPAATAAAADQLASKPPLHQVVDVSVTKNEKNKGSATSTPQPPSCTFFLVRRE